jgi:sodium/potassium-transporting ATPase subunit alpha
MREPPRSRNEPLLSRPLLIHSYLFLGLIQAAFSSVLFFSTLRLGGWEYGQELAENDPLYRSATGVALTSIILMQIGNLIGRRSRYHSGLDKGLLANRLILLGIALEAAFSWAILYFPPVQRVLGTGPAPLDMYIFAWLGAPLLFAADLLRKKLHARHKPVGGDFSTASPYRAADRGEA